MTKKENILQFIKFIAVGVYNLALSYLVYSVFILLGFHYMLSNAISFCFSILNSFWCTRKFVFPGGKSKWRSLFKVIVSYIGTGLILQSILLFIWIQLLEIPELIAPVCNILILTPCNYVLGKFWAYK